MFERANGFPERDILLARGEIFRAAMLAFAFFVLLVGGAILFSRKYQRGRAHRSAPNLRIRGGNTVAVAGTHVP